MTTFYRLMLFLTRFGLQIARSTGRNPESVAQLSREEAEYELLLFQAEKSLFDEEESQ